MANEQLLALAVFALTGSFTPGPNNTIATVTGANHGLRAALPHILGVPLGFSALLVAGGLGAAALIVAHPLLATAIKWIGVAYLLYIAWQIALAAAPPPSAASAAPTASGIPGERGLARPLTLWQSAAFQFANPKAWMLAAATAGAYMAGDEPAARIAIACGAFSLASMASLVAWAAAGDAMKSWLRHGQRLRVFNLTMGGLLAATAVWMASQ